VRIVLKNLKFHTPAYQRLQNASAFIQRGYWFPDIREAHQDNQLARQSGGLIRAR